MTAQESDILLYDSKEYELSVTPDDNGMINARWCGRTSNDRGYIGVWEIQNGLLYLKEVYEGRMNKRGPIFADWLTEELWVWNGELLNYVHAGFGSMFEEDIIFTVRNGIVADTRTQSNVEKFCEYAKTEVKGAKNKIRISYLYHKYLNPEGNLTKLIQKENANQAAYMLLQLELEELFKERLHELAKDPESGIVLQYK